MRIDRRGMNDVTFAQVYKAHVDPRAMPPDAVRWIVLWKSDDSPRCETRGLRLDLDDLVAAEEEAAEIIGIPVECWKEIDGYSEYRRDPVPPESAAV